MNINDRGSALLVVLLMLTVFSIIGMTVVGMAANNATQIKKTGNEIKSTNLAEMGVDHLKKMTALILTQNSQETLEKSKNELALVLPNREFFSIKTASTYPRYQFDQITVNSRVESDKEVLLVDFTSVGIAEDQQKEKITGTIIAYRGKSAGGFPARPSEMKTYSEMDFDKKENTISKPAYFEDKLLIPSNTDLNFIENAYFEKGFSTSANTTHHFNKDLFLKGNSSIVSNSDVSVNGNLYLDEIFVKTNKNHNGNQGLLCVDGTLYLYGEEELEVISNTNGCSRIVSEKHNSGIFATKVVNLPATPQPGAWRAENISIDALYQ